MPWAPVCQCASHHRTGSRLHEVDRNVSLNFMAAVYQEKTVTRCAILHVFSVSNALCAAVMDTFSIQHTCLRSHVASEGQVLPMCSQIQPD